MCYKTSQLFYNAMEIPLIPSTFHLRENPLTPLLAIKKPTAIKQFVRTINCGIAQSFVLFSLFLFRFFGFIRMSECHQYN